MAARLNAAAVRNNDFIPSPPVRVVVMAASIDLLFRLLDYRCPFGHFGSYECVELFRRVGHGLIAHVDEPVADFPRTYDLCHVAAHFGDHLAWRLRRRHDAEPGIGDEAGIAE